MSADEWLKHATVFQFGGKILPIRIEARDQRDGARKWVVCNGPNVLRRDGEWQYEPLPSSRTDEFIAETRFASKDFALAMLKEAMER